MNDTSFRLVLARAPQTPALARAAIREWLTGRHVGEQIRADILVVVSELVTNAVMHTDSTSELVVNLDDGRLRLEVHDRYRTPPVARASPDATGGFGLRLVGELTDMWGWAPTSTGKYVWTETLV